MQVDEGEFEKEGKDVIDINVLPAVLFVLLASALLMLLYFYMSAWFMRVLVRSFSALAALRVCRHASCPFCTGGFRRQEQLSTMCLSQEQYLSLLFPSRPFALRLLLPRATTTV